MFFMLHVLDSLWQWMYPPPPPPFFAGDKRPKGLPGISNGTEIKQNLPTDAPGTPPYFVTLFDATRNIPFYSAYKVTPAQAPYIGSHGRQEANWREPPGKQHNRKSFIIHLPVISVDEEYGTTG